MLLVLSSGGPQLPAGRSLPTKPMGRGWLLTGCLFVLLPSSPLHPNTRELQPPSSVSTAAAG
ncbi:hypothetical protein E2C01_102108 [Portunus trituberculatus]|uniref:Uncharacterized protein n=1 Tax=Portunus trituberculatus TaxID=210409 RepID=A0A5B7KCA7_PORTR|nr:hypothetical protein [Portunus trituberculatus]